MDADLGKLEHSNVVRLYRVHPKDNDITGTYRIYVPGIGTYFKEVGDKGGTITGNGFGAERKKRLDWALKQFDDKLAPHLARAFIRDFIAKRCTQIGAGLQLKQGKCPLRVRFMGLFDTVASVGAPMSANNLSVTRTDRMTVANAARAIGGAFEYAVTKASPKTLRAVDIAFGAPGADPAPGIADGHGDWADGLHIPPAVEQAVHFVAAHEVRNSFPVDSVCDGGIKPGNCKEMVYPGVHSNVGGGYRPGEEGKSGYANQMLSQIALRHMYDEALDMGAPFLPEKAWQQDNKDDFDTSNALKERYNHYMSLAGWGGKSLGKTMNAHMAVYHAWRFAQIRRKQKGDKSLAGRIEGNEAQYSAERQKADRDITELTRKEMHARWDVTRAEMERSHYLQRQGYGNITPAKLKPYDDNIAAAQQAHSVAQDELLRAKARRDTLPGEGDALIKNLEQYDAQLIADAQSLRDACLHDLARRSRLRPHYRGLLEAYENEFFLNKGLADEKIFAFFESHIHDSLAGFAQDSTLPSDPHVVYLGKDVKSQHSMNEKLDVFTEQQSVPA
ncbi:MAG: DUF2235 domain-containing protein [Gammaproteobacteria bacterium]